MSRMGLPVAAPTESGGMKLKVKEAPDVLGSLPFTEVHGADLTLFGEVEKGEFEPEEAHFELFGKGFGTTLRMELGRRNGQNLRFKPEEAMDILKGCGLKPRLPKGGVEVRTTKNGESYVVVEYRH